MAFRGAWQSWKYITLYCVQPSSKIQVILEVHPCSLSLGHVLLTWCSLISGWLWAARLVCVDQWTCVENSVISLLTALIVSFLVKGQQGKHTIFRKGGRTQLCCWKPHGCWQWSRFFQLILPAWTHGFCSPLCWVPRSLLSKRDRGEPFPNCLSPVPAFLLPQLLHSLMDLSLFWLVGTMDFGFLGMRRLLLCILTKIHQ